MKLLRKEQIPVSKQNMRLLSPFCLPSHTRFLTAAQVFRVFFCLLDKLSTISSTSKARVTHYTGRWWNICPETLVVSWRQLKFHEVCKLWQRTALRQVFKNCQVVFLAVPLVEVTFSTPHPPRACFSLVEPLLSILFTFWEEREGREKGQESIFFFKSFLKNKQSLFPSFVHVKLMHWFRGKA